MQNHDQKKIKKTAPRWHRHPESRRQDILDAALTVFAEKGFYAAHTKEIARRAGITSGTSYLYFTSKEEILKTLVEESIAPQVSQLAQMAREFEGATPDLIRIVIRTLFMFLRNSDRAVLPKLIIAESGNFPELARHYKEHVTDRMLGMFGQIVQRGVERGEFRQTDPTHAGRLLFVPLMFTAIWRASFGAMDSEPFDYEGLIETHLDLMLRGLAMEQKRP